MSGRVSRGTGRVAGHGDSQTALAWHLRQQGLLLLSHLPPDLGDLVNLRVEEAVLGPVSFHVILEERAFQELTTDTSWS